VPPQPRFIADRLLDQARELFRCIFNESSDAFVISRRSDLQILEVNEAFERLSGIDREEALGVPNGLIALSSEPRDISSMHDRLVTEGHLVDEPLVITARDGDRRHVRLSAHGIELVGEQCVLSRLTDVTLLFESELRRVRAVNELLKAEESIRSGLAMDLHDDTLQVLAAANFELARVETRLGSAGDAENSAAVGRIRELLSASADRTRDLMFQLRPRVLTTEGLRPALALLAKALAVDAGPEISVDAPAQRYDARVEQLVWRTIREALINVIRHAEAHQAVVRICERDQRLHCSVADDGVGFDAGSPAGAEHFGIDTMRERIEGLGGNLTIESSPGEGTTVRFTVPLPGTRG
jgi:PAS domain S-box-containing protein